MQLRLVPLWVSPVPILLPPFVSQILLVVPAICWELCKQLGSDPHLAMDYAPVYQCVYCTTHVHTDSFQSYTTLNEKEGAALGAALRPSVAAQGSALMRGSVRVVMCLKKNPKLLLLEELFSGVGIHSSLWMT